MKVILLHPDDNILVVIAPVTPGDEIILGDEAFLITAPIAVGHKLARRALGPGEKIIKYGAPIGSTLGPIERGAHVHQHNMKSDYIASHARDTLERSTKS